VSGGLGQGSKTGETDGTFLSRNMEPLGSELFRQSAASYERTFWSPGTDENGKETIVRDRRVQSFPDTLEIEDGCTLGLQQGECTSKEVAVCLAADIQHYQI
jgi:hypothetical protein